MPCESRSRSPAAASPYSNAMAPCVWRATMIRGPTILTWRSDMKASTFALVFGIAYLAAGVLGLVPAALVPPPADAPSTHFALMYGYLLGLFPVNILHTAVHLAIGAWGLVAWSGRTSAVTFARALAALVAAYVGWREPAHMRERRRMMTDRRQQMVPVAYERRFGLADRRERF